MPAAAWTYVACAAFALALFTAGSARAAGGSGGAGVAPPPQLLDGRCIDRPAKECTDPRWVEPGGALRLRGRYLSGVTAVIFYGRAGKADDVRAPSRPRSTTVAVVNVPQQARNGAIAVITGAGARSPRWSGIVIDELGEAPNVRQPGGNPGIGADVSAPQRVFYGGLRKAVFNYRIASSRPLDVTVTLVRLADSVVVRTWQQAQVAPEVGRRVIWDGTAGGRVQPEGLYTFRASVASASGAVGTPASGGEDSFAFYDHMFPVRGRHDFGGTGSRFGAGRGGRSHQGQDVFAACGTPLIAARAGKVSYRGYHSLAGYYVVIAGGGSEQDYVYMHLRAPARVKAGEAVYTGQSLGEVGDSGNAHGCHLHFELWSAPGWYRGGRPFDPLPELRRWDRAS